MDFQQELYASNTPNLNKRSKNMAIASMILGIIALITCCCIYSAMVCGSLGIILALLSRGGNQTLESQGTAGLVLSSIGLALTLAIYIGIFLMMLRQYGGIDGILQEYMRLYNADTIEELYQNIGVFQQFQ